MKNVIIQNWNFIIKMAFVVTFIALCPSFVFGQCSNQVGTTILNISGCTNVVVGDEETYHSNIGDEFTNIISQNWNVVGGVKSNETDQSVDIQWNSTGSKKVSFTACVTEGEFPDDEIIFYDGEEITVVVASVCPTANVSNQTYTHCDSNVTLQAVAGRKKYYWYKNGAATSFANGTSNQLVVAASSLTSYRVKAEGCAGCISTFSNTATVTYNGPVIYQEEISLTGISSTHCNAGEPIKLALGVPAQVTNGTTFELYKDNLLINSIPKNSTNQATIDFLHTGEDGTYSVKALYNNCSELLDQISGIGTNTIIPHVGSVSITSPSIIRCIGGSATSQFTHSNASNAINGYTWSTIPSSAATSFSSSGLFTWNNSYLEGTTLEQVTVKVIAQGCDGSTSEATQVVTIRPSPPTANAVSYCGATVTLSANAGYANYEWYDTNNNLLGASTSISKSVNATGFTQYKVKGKKDGCWSVYSGLVNVTNNGPTVYQEEISLTGIASDHCNSGDPIKLVLGVPSQVPNGTTFELYKDGVLIKAVPKNSTNQALFDFTHTGANGTYSVKAKKTAGSTCSELLDQISGIGTNTIIPHVGSVNITSPSIIRCIGGSATSQFTRSNASNAINGYTWSTVPFSAATSFSSSNQNGVLTWNDAFLASTTLEQVTVKITATGCDGSNSIDTQIVPIRSAPPTAQGITYCGTQVTLSAVENTYAQYEWFDENNNLLGTSGTNSASFNISQFASVNAEGDTEYSVRAKVSGGCLSVNSPKANVTNEAPTTPQQELELTGVRDNHCDQGEQIKFVIGVESQVPNGTTFELYHDDGTNNIKVGTTLIKGQTLDYDSDPDIYEMYFDHTGVSGIYSVKAKKTAGSTCALLLDQIFGVGTNTITPDVGSVSITTSETSRCIGEAATSQFTHSAASDATNGYTWSIDPTSAELASPSPFSSTGLLTWNDAFLESTLLEEVTVTITANGCSGSTSIDTQVVTIRSAPLIAQDVTHCGTEVTLSTADDGYAQFEWFDENGNSLGTSLANSATFDLSDFTGVSVEGDTGYSVRAKASGGCWSIKSTQVNVTYDGPEIYQEEIELTGISLLECHIGTPIKLVLAEPTEEQEAHKTAPDGTVFILYKDGVEITREMKLTPSNPGPVTIDFNHLGESGIYSVEALYNNCTVLLDQISGATENLVTPYVGSVSISSADPSKRCQGEGTSSFSHSGATDAVSYSWSMSPTTGAGYISSLSGVVTWDAGFSGQATITVTANGCGNSKEIDSMTVTVIPSTIAPSPETQTYLFCQNEQIRLIGDPSDIYDVFWYNDAETLLIPSAQPSYSVELSPQAATYTFKYKYFPKSGECPIISPQFGIIKVKVDTYCDDKLNTVLARTFSIDVNGQETETSSSKAYFDYSGQLLQTQSKAYEKNTFFASEPMYDSYDRSVGSTLSAPIFDPDNAVLQTQFGYKLAFNKASDGEVYDHSKFHFDGGDNITDDPMFVSQETGTLGWYYSNNNNLEENVPTTSYPYSRTDFYEDGSGEVKRSAGPGDFHRMGAGHESITKTLPIGADELPRYKELRALILGLDNDDPNELTRVHKQIGIDPNGKEVVTYIGENGEAIGSALISSGGPVSFVYPADEVHIPYNESDPVAKVPVTFDAGSKTIYNKINEREDPIQSTNTVVLLAPGIYNVEGSATAAYNSIYSNYSYIFYDNLGRQRASISPLGMVPLLAMSSAEIEAMSITSLTNVTFNTYDFLGRLLQTDEPDAGRTQYLYRKDGSIRFSQNAEQAIDPSNSNDLIERFSYTCYDDSGRPIESGEYFGDVTFISQNSSTILEETGFSSHSDAPEDQERMDWVETYYDIPEAVHIGDYETALKSFYDTYFGITHQHGVELYSNQDLAIIRSQEYEQDFTYGAVSYTQNENVTTWYSYDEFGRVTSMMMEYADMDRFFTLDYKYDFTGNVLQVAYQKNIPGEAFFHHYTYDKDNRLHTVSTSVDSQNQYLQAEYDYYLHGPLKRVEYASDLQGIDYTYTIQGWLKAINNPANTTDTTPIDLSKTFSNDVFGMTLEYFNGDYVRGGSPLPSNVGMSISEADATPQYSGNIRAAAWSRDNLSLERFYDTNVVVDEFDPDNPVVTAGGEIVIENGYDSDGNDAEFVIDPEATYVEEEGLSNLYAYQYDDKYQLLSAKYAEQITSPVFAGKYDLSNLSYDVNGNIQALSRTNKLGSILDSFQYQYNDQNGSGLRINNQLSSIPGYSDYAYNSIGQLTASTVNDGGARAKYGSQFYDYDVTGKVKSIYGDQERTEHLVQYEYDDRGFRIAKKDIESGNTTWYVRDASGNIVSIYEEKNDEVEQIELPIYGATKLGTSFRNYQRYKYNYEITDHLGNVRSVISKLKFMETATMEPVHSAREEAVFANVSETSEKDAIFNTTYNGLWSSMLNGGATVEMETGHVIGPAVSLEVNKGDKIKLEVNSRFTDFDNQPVIPGIIGFLASTFGVTNGVGSETANIYSGLENAANLLSLVMTTNTNAPKAYLMCMVFDENYTLIDPDVAGYDYYKAVSDAGASGFENLYLELEIPEGGKYIYNFVANESIGTNVFFDDFTVTQLGVDITETTDYYPFGSIASHWSKEDYRFGYQGEFAEEDEETGFNHFEARAYDSKIGKWLTVDPLRQIYSSWSPYNNVFNNPIRSADPDGRGPIDRVIAALRFIGKGYKNENTASLRTAWTDDALKYTDCTETICRLLALDDITDNVKWMTTTWNAQPSEFDNIVDYFQNSGDFIISQTPQEGDFMLYKKHMSFVFDVDPTSSNVKALAGLGTGKTLTVNSSFQPASIYGSNFIGYVRPKIESPDRAIMLDEVVIEATSTYTNPSKNFDDL